MSMSYKTYRESMKHHMHHPGVAPANCKPHMHHPRGCTPGYKHAAPNGADYVLLNMLLRHTLIDHAGSQRFVLFTCARFLGQRSRFRPGFIAVLIDISDTAI